MGRRDELVAAIAERYSRADRAERGRIVDEFTAVSGFHRKQAMRVLGVGQPNRRSGTRPGRRIHDDVTRKALIVIWEASDRICGKRLRPLAHPIRANIQKYLSAMPALLGIEAMLKSHYDQIARAKSWASAGAAAQHQPPPLSWPRVELRAGLGQNLSVPL